MSNNRFRFDGLEALKAQLRALPAELAAEASPIVLDAGTEAAEALRAVYQAHAVTSHLADSVSVVTRSQGRFGAGAEVRISDPIAWLFDNGSQARHWVRGKSTGTMWGKTPPTHVAVRTLQTKRRAMYTRFKALLEAKGLAVTGEA